eukprot:gene334-966_t
MSYDPSKWYSYSKNRQNVDEDIPSNKSAYIRNCEEEIGTTFSDGTTTSEPIGTEKSTYIETNPSSTAVESTKSEIFSQGPGLETLNINQELDSKKLNDTLRRLQKMTMDLPGMYKKRLTYDILTELAKSLLDDTVYEIVKGLEEIQQISERSLLQKRMKVLSDHKVQRAEMKKKHQETLLDCQSRPHQKKVVEREYFEERKIFEERLEKELNQLDQKHVLEFDQQVIDQQATLQRAGVPLFSITNKPEDVQLQMYLLDFISRLIPDSSK